MAVYRITEYQYLQEVRTAQELEAVFRRVAAGTEFSYAGWQNQLILDVIKRREEGRAQFPALWWLWQAAPRGAFVGIAQLTQVGRPPVIARVERVDTSGTYDRAFPPVHPAIEALVRRLHAYASLTAVDGGAVLAPEWLEVDTADY